MYQKKKIAPRAAAPETSVEKKISINSILKNGGKVKCVIKRPGEVPQTISAYDIPWSFLSRKLRAERINTGLTLVYESQSNKPINLAVDDKIYRGTVLVVNKGIDRLHDLSVRETNEAVVWIMRHKV